MPSHREPRTTDGPHDDDLFATLSHELRTPLTSIHGALSLLVEHGRERLGERYDELVEVAYRNSERLAQLLDEVLAERKRRHRKEQKAPAGRRLADLTWTEVRDLDRERVVAILPLGAVEAHGPHLPLSTDRIIAAAMAEEGARLLASAGRIPLLLPAIDYTAAPFAAAFAGTVSAGAETVSALIADVANALAGHGFGVLALANAHFDPAHLGAIRAAIERIAGKIDVVFPDVTRRPWIDRLTAELRSGACHAGQYETSVVLAERPDLVRKEVSRRLEANPRSLSRAIRDGKSTFDEAGGPDAYFGDPAAASADEGAATVRALGQILADAVLDGTGPSGLAKDAG